MKISWENDQTTVVMSRICVGDQDCRTSCHDITTLIYQLLCHVVVPYKLLEPQELKNATPKAEVCADTQKNNQNGKIDIETI